jgi:hypothetical protein
MYQANLQPWGGSAPVLFNQRQGDDLESINLALGDLGSFYAGFPSFATPPGASQPSGLQSPGVSLLPSPEFSGFVTPYEDLPLDASPIPSPANYAALSGFEEAAGTCLPLYAACTGFEQLPGSSVPLSSAYNLNHAALSGFREAPANEPLLPQPQSDYGDIPENFPNHALFNQATLPLNSAHRECQYPGNDQNPEQDDSNHVPSYFEQILGPVTSNYRPKPQRCMRCRKLKRTVFLSS